MKSSKSYQLHKSSEASESVLHIRKTCKAKGLEIVQKKKRIEKEYPGGFLTARYNKVEFGKYYTEI